MQEIFWVTDIPAAPATRVDTDRSAESNDESKGSPRWRVPASAHWKNGRATYRGTAIESKIAPAKFPPKSPYGAAEAPHNPQRRPKADSKAPKKER